MTAPDTDAFRAAAAAVPAYADALAAQARVTAYAARHPMPENRTGDSDILADALAHLDAGDDLPDDLGERAVQARRRHQAAVAAATLAGTLLRMHSDAPARALAQGADDALEVLSSRLEDVLDRARALAPRLPAPVTADACAERGPDAQRAYLELAEQLGEYRDIRQAQQYICRCAAARVVAAARRHIRQAPDWAEIAKWAAEMQHYDRAWPQWRAGYVPDPHRTGTLRADQPPPWPQDADPSRRRYTPAYLLWAADDDGGGKAGIWVPGIDAMAEAWATATRAADARRAAAAAAERRREQAAREAHGQLTHATHPRR